MANTDLTTLQITREALRLLHNNAVFMKNTNKEYSKEFAQSGAKIGATCNVRVPPKYYVTKSAVLAAQNFTETSVPVTVDTQWQVGLKFTQAELTLSLDDFSKRVLAPAMSKLATSIDMDGLALAEDIYNQVGTAGTTPGSGTGGTGLLCYTTPNVFLNAGALLDSNAVPRDENRRVVLEPFAMAASVAGLSGLLNAPGKISEQYNRGVLGDALGFTFASDQNVCRHTTGTGVTTTASIVASGASQTGATFVAKGFNAVGNTLLKGDVFTIAGVYGVNPENQQSTGQLQQFVVTATATAASTGGVTAASISISPSIIVAGTGVANGTVTAAPADSAALTFLTPGASTDYPLSLAYHKDAFTLATVDLEMPRGVDMAMRQEYDGISMLIVRAYDINTSQFPCRVDILGGWKTIRPEMACRIIG